MRYGRDRKKLIKQNVQAAEKVNYTCPACSVKESDSADAMWVSCDICDKWYHVECTDIAPDDYDKISCSMDWYCDVCIAAKF